MKYYVLSSNKFNDIANRINEYMQNELSLNTELVIKNNDLAYAIAAHDIAKEIVQAKREGIALILIDETGGLGFAATSKVKGMITAQISDEHSSHMTREHNGSVAIALGANISAEPQLKSIIKLFSEEEFAAGRHMVRIDMLDKMA